MIKIGFIGAGNMGSALARSVEKTGAEIFVSDASIEKAELLAQEVSGAVTDNLTIANTCDLIFFGVKPNIIPVIIDPLKEALKERVDDFAIVSMAAGVTIGKITALMEFDCPVIRIMPNTPVSVGEGMILWSANSFVSDKLKADFLASLVYAGALDELDEELIDSGCAISGCGPAFVFSYIEALAKGAIAVGVPADKATDYAIQTVLGAAKLAKESELDTQALKNAVCSPGGATIEGVRSLDASSFDETVADAIKASFKRTKELGK